MKKKLSKFDIFPALPTLRAEGESQVVNLCSSIFSILIFGAFVYVFMSSMISTINYQTIDSKQILTMNRPANQPISNITIGVGIQFANILALRQFFQLRAFIGDRTLQFRPIDVFPCKREMWAALDDIKYKTLNLEQHMCIQKENISIYGEFGTPQVQFIMFNLSICSNLTSPVPCASPGLITWFFANKMFWGRFIPSSLVILDTGISATNVNPLTYNPYQKTQFLLFNQKQQMFIQAFIGTYQINTDTSFLPFQQVSQQKGHFVTECAMTTIVNYLNSDALLDVYIFPSPVHRIINRSYGKIDDILSYVGGLYGIVVSFIGMFLMSFNQYKYQLRVSQGAFSYKDSHLAREKDLNFLKFLKYSLYSWVSTLTCYEPNWPDCKAINQSRQQAVEQIDVKHLLQRISHLQKVTNTFFNSQGEISMYMVESNSIQEVKRRRDILEYCGKFTGDINSPTIQGFQMLDKVVGFGLSQFAKTESSLLEQHDRSPSLDHGNQQNQENHQNQQTSLAIMDKYVKRYIRKYNITDRFFQLSESDKKAEEDLAESFYNLEEQTRRKIIKKIPLGILYRLYAQKNKKQIVNSYEQPPKQDISCIQLSSFHNSVKGSKRRKKNRKRIQIEYQDHTVQLES